MVKQSGQISGEHPDNERRRSVGIFCSGFAEGLSRNPSQLFRGEIRNVSETGCFISVRAAVSLAAGAIVELRLRLCQTEYRALARVMEAMPSTGIRMQFIATEPTFAEHIRRILNAHPNKPISD